MSNKNKSLEVKVEIPDDKHLKHIVDAYGLVCQYRTVNKVPHEKMESWLLRLVVEGCNALYNFHNQQLLKAAEEKEKLEKEVSKYQDLQEEVMNEQEKAIVSEPVAEESIEVKTGE